MGRSNRTVRQFDFQAVARAGRFGRTKAGACSRNEDFFFDPNLSWSNKHYAASLGTDAYLCVSTSSNPQMGSGQPTSSTCTFYTTLRKMAGICRDSTVPMVTYFGYGNQGGAWNTTESKVLEGDRARRYTMAASSTAKRLAAVGLAAQSQIFGMRSGTAR